MNVEEKTKPEKKSWAQKYSESPHADKWLSFFSFTESSFFPLPPSTLMVAIMSVKDRHKKWIYYGTLTTITSVLGGLFGYLIGNVFYDTLGQGIVETYNLSADIEKVSIKFQDNAFLTILIAAATPIPYKVFTLAAGFFGIDIFTFTIASLIGRGARFYLVAFIISILGEKMGKKAMRRLNLIALLVALVIVAYFFYKIIAFAAF